MKGEGEVGTPGNKGKEHGRWEKRGRKAGVVKTGRTNAPINVKPQGGGGGGRPRGF